MQSKPNWPQARDRLTALWEGRPLDRPCIAVTAPSGQDAHWPPAPESPQQKWFDADWIARQIQALLQATYWGGEAIPSYLVMGGWVVCFGGRPQLAMDTIWHEPISVDFDQPPRFDLDWNEPWLVRHEQLYLRVAELAGQDRFLLGQPCCLPATDLLAAVLGTQEALMAMAEQPQWVDAALKQLTANTIAVRLRLRQQVEPIHRYWYGNAQWMPFWAPKPYVATQSDISCMLSPDMYQRYVLPDLDATGREHGAVWYHLDGHDARQHLPRLLSLPYLRVLQYTPTPSEAPNGPNQLDLYRQVQAAGKIVHVQMPPQNVEAVVRATDPNLIMIDTYAPSPRQADDLLQCARTWANQARVTSQV